MSVGAGGGPSAEPSAIAAAAAAGVGFSIYSPNISFEQDYRSNYTHHNAQIVLAASEQEQQEIAAANGRSSLAPSPEKSVFGYRTAGPTATITTAAATADLMAGLERKGFYIVKSTRVVQSTSALPLSAMLKAGTGGNICNNNNATVANNNLASDDCGNIASKGMVESLHNYSKQRCEEETDRMRRKACARFADEDEDDEDDEDDDDEDTDNVDGDEIVVDVEGAVDDAVPTVGLPEPMQPIALPIEVKAAPEHHARRPMNAFLIFCKRHRGIVREKYPNLENRAITKILGDWWANIDGAEKESFNRLAREVSLQRSPRSFQAH